MAIEVGNDNDGSFFSRNKGKLLIAGVGVIALAIGKWLNSSQDDEEEDEEDEPKAISN